MSNLRIFAAVAAAAVLVQGCVSTVAGAAAGAAIGVTGAVVGGAVKGAGAVGRAVIPGGSDDEQERRQ